MHTEMLEQLCLDEIGEIPSEIKLWHLEDGFAEYLVKFENNLAAKLNIKNYIAVSNGTIALQMAIKALGVKNEVITSPFTWIATISALKWEGCQPVFCDIDPETLNIDPNKM